MRIEDLCPISSTDDQCSCNLDDLAETCELKLGNCYCSVDVLLVSDYIMPIFSNHIGGGVSQRKKFFIGENINRFYFSLLDFNLLDREKQKLNSPHSTCNHLYEANLLFNNQFCVLDFWCVMWHSGQYQFCPYHRNWPQPRDQIIDIYLHQNFLWFQKLIQADYWFAFLPP